MLEEWQFWGLVWGIAASAGVARALRDSDYDDCLSLVSVGLFSGLLGFGVVAIWVGSAGGHVGSEPRYLGLAALLGLAGKEQDRLVRFIIAQTFDRLGVPELPDAQSVLGDDLPVDHDHGFSGGDRVEHDRPEE